MPKPRCSFVRDFHANILTHNIHASFGALVPEIWYLDQCFLVPSRRGLNTVTAMVPP